MLSELRRYSYLRYITQPGAVLGSVGSDVKEKEN